MADKPPPDAMLAAEASIIDADARTRLLVGSVVRVTLAVLVLIGLYAVVPLDETLVGGALVLLATAVIAFFVFVFARQVRRILRAGHPVLQAAESLVILAVMFIVLFSAVYVTLSASQPLAFDQSLSKIDGIYFTVVTLGTVGYGDIHAVTDPAKLLVTVQILLDLALAGTAIKIISGAAKVGLRRQLRDAQGEEAAAGGA